MFLEHYGLREQQFGVTPDPSYLYFSEMHREALASLFYGIETGCGFLSLIAPPGTGKTTLLLHLLERLQKSAKTVFLFQTQCDSREFFRYLLTLMERWLFPWRRVVSQTNQSAVAAATAKAHSHAK